MFNIKNKKEKSVSPKQKAISYMQQANDFEKSRIDMVLRNNKIAWIIAGLSCCITIIAVIAVMLLSPLKSVQPYVIRVDNNTGATDIVTTLKDAKERYGEVVDKYWLTQYVKFRESYDWYTVQASYDTTMLLSSKAIQRDIASFFASPGAPYKVLKDQFRVDIKILSVSWVGDVAQIRFEKQISPLNEGSEKPPKQRMMATIGYQYLNTPQNEKDRLSNPLGLQVMSYRVDPESGM